MVTRFSHADVDAFAAASYDRNPLHVDEAYARRTVFGRRVVHGVASLLRALAELPAREGRSLASLTAHFPNPIFLDVPYVVHVEEASADDWIVTLKDGSSTAMRARTLSRAGSPRSSGRRATRCAARRTHGRPPPAPRSQSTMGQTATRSRAGRTPRRASPPATSVP